MQRLDKIAKAIKSANAGASYLTFDILFADRSSFDRVVRSGAINKDRIATLYNAEPSRIDIYECEPVLTIKVTIPRATASGGPEETDFDGTQQFAPLLDLEVH